MKISTLLFVCMLLASEALAQGQVTETVPPTIQRLMQVWVDNNKATPSLKGWRIQILASTDRMRVENALSQFRFRYPNLPADWVHQKPYYKLQAGAYLTRRDALSTLYVIKQDYPGAYLVQTSDIKPEELLW